MAGAAVVLMLCVAAPELAAPAGAAPPTAAGTAASRPNGHVVLVARRRSRAAVRRARVRAYLKGHPKLTARKVSAHPAAFARQLRKKGIPAKTPRQARAGKRRRRAGRAHVSAKVRRKRAATAAKRKHRRRAGAAAVAAKRHKKKKSAGSGYSLSAIDWLAIALLVLAPFAVVALWLYITDVQRRPRAPSRSKRRRSLVITPLNKS